MYETGDDPEPALVLMDQELQEEDEAPELDLSVIQDERADADDALIELCPELPFS